MRKKLLLDVDEVICFAGFLDAINEFMQTTYEIDDFEEYYIDKVVIPKDRFNEFNEFVNKKNLYEKAFVLPNAINVINELDEFYDIYICSSCINPFDINGSGRIFKNKYDFLRSKFPFINPQNFIFTNAKNLIKADIIIDDLLSNLENMEVDTKILFPSYHNKDIPNEELDDKYIIRAGYNWKDGWQEVSKILIKKKGNDNCE